MKELISCDLESVLTYLLDLTRGLSMTLKNENASQTESPSLISEILTKEPGLMRPARPNKSWAEDLPRSPFLLSFTARLRKAADGSSPRPCQEGKVVAVVQGLTRFLPRTSRDWLAEKGLSVGASQPLRNANGPLDICRASWFWFFLPCLIT